MSPLLLPIFLQKYSTLSLLDPVHFQHLKAIVPFHSAIFPNHHIRADTTLVLHIHMLACLLPYSSILFCQQHIYFLTLQLHILPYQVLRLHPPFCPPYSYKHHSNLLSPLCIATYILQPHQFHTHQNSNSSLS